MPVPDVGLAPPPPVDVSSQMQPSAPSAGAGGAPNLNAILQMLGGQGAPPLTDVTPKVLDLEPFLDQIARQVPALGPDVDRLNIELKARMGGLPMALASMSQGAPGAPTGPPLTGAGPIQGAPNPGVPNPGMPSPAAGPQALPTVPPNPIQDMGALDTAMQIELKLPALGKDDPSLMPYIQGFIARMREEVPKVVSGETEAVSPPVQSAPTESMLSRIPVSY